MYKKENKIWHKEMLNKLLSIVKLYFKNVTLSNWEVTSIFAFCNMGATPKMEYNQFLHIKFYFQCKNKKPKQFLQKIKAFFVLSLNSFMYYFSLFKKFSFYKSDLSQMGCFGRAVKKQKLFPNFVTHTVWTSVSQIQHSKTMWGRLCPGIECFRVSDTQRLWEGWEPQSLCRSL